jgi:hypothetical protein
MLVDEPLVVRASFDPILMIIGAVGNRAVLPEHPRTGVYVVGHFGSSDFLSGYESYPNLSDVLLDPGHYDDNAIGPYGVCDGIDNLLERCPLLEASERRFVVCLTKVERDQSNRGRGGGWRWRKWGEYIGSKTPTTEYLDDEPDISEVYVYHVYEKVTP